MDRRGGGGTFRVVLRLTSEAATRPNRGTQHAQHNPRTLITQTLEGGARDVDEGDGKFFFCFLAKETETRMKTRSVEMFSHARLYFPVYNKRGITLCMYHHAWVSKSHRQGLLPGVCSGASTVTQRKLPRVLTSFLESSF